MHSFMREGGINPVNNTAFKLALSLSIYFADVSKTEKRSTEDSNPYEFIQLFMKASYV